MKINVIENFTVKSMMIDILKKYAKYCKDNNLCYYLFYGTLIEAIRHNGYIPWDNDIDVAMPRPNY